MALNRMHYADSSYSMAKLAAWSFFSAKYVGLRGFLLTWTPFLVLIATLVLLLVFL